MRGIINWLGARGRKTPIKKMNTPHLDNALNRMTRDLDHVIQHVKDGNLTGAMNHMNLRRFCPKLYHLLKERSRREYTVTRPRNAAAEQLKKDLR